jgi:hypothetical protein
VLNKQATSFCFFLKNYKQMGGDALRGRPQDYAERIR